ncbi:IS5 family transposase [Streptomyces gelaticus]|uniref:IS5 family transposase n=1 Tax=Streptomyces gelaticus TaxID=285446 RepID=UPI001E2D4B35|nr:IS5 family transposase [Streptomyces gelaticus]
MPRGHPRGTSDLIHPEKITGERCAGKLARTVREGAVGKGPGPRAPRRRPTSLRRWRRQALDLEFHDRLRGRVRISEGRAAAPTAGIIDSQSVRAASSVPAATRGYDGGKKVPGRKRHVITDCLGLLLVVAVTAANVGDREAAAPLLERARASHRSLRLIWADGGYTGMLVDWAGEKLHLVLEIVKRSDEPRFVVLPRRWVVERTLSRLMRSRRLARGYETLPATSKSMILWSMTMLMSRRLARRTHPATTTVSLAA